MGILASISEARALNGWKRGGNTTISESVDILWRSRVWLNSYIYLLFDTK